MRLGWLSSCSLSQMLCRKTHMKQGPPFSHISTSMTPTWHHSPPYISFSPSRMFCRVQNLAGSVLYTALIFVMLPLMSALMGLNTGDPRQSKKGGRWDTTSRKGPVSTCLSEGSGFNRCSASSTSSGSRLAVMPLSNQIFLFLPQHTPNLLWTDHPNPADP
ncbi:hypothetical protein MDA_GLEAN10011573 [Myotis davidii]|uniref:Uncharacterized protein n=1 Tax=Myotis davidii TaxID=225400 RepID=L5M5S1_MYODS|nr:hypothetical protein MDA_GLEAN10011573 [Myotis davidii]